MKEHYRNAMNRIQADDEFKSNLLLKLESEKQKPKKKSAFVRYIPVLSSAAAVIVLTLAIFASKAFILPLLKHDNEVAKNNKNPVSDRFDIEEKTEDKVLYDEYADDDFIVQGVTTDNAEPEKPQEKEEITPIHDNAMELNDVDYSEPYNLICYSTDTDVTIKGLSEAKSTVYYDTTLHFYFEGFEKYNIGLMKNDIVFMKTLPEDYTLADFFNDHYSVIIGQSTASEMAVDEGILYTFFDIDASEDDPINVYVNETEILNLETTLMSEFKDMSDVYFAITVE